MRFHSVPTLAEMALFRRGITMPSGIKFKISSRPFSTLPVSVKISSEERTDKQLSWKSLELAVRSLHRDGLVVLEDAIDHSRLNHLNSRMVEDADYLHSLGEAGPYNYNKGSVIEITGS